MRKPEELYNDYLLVRKMTCETKRKVRLLSELFADAPDPWKVTGITTAALKVLSENQFRYKSKMGINRSHLTDRNQTYKEMLGLEFDSIDSWWEYFLERDITILTTAKENISKKHSEVINIDFTLGLFRNRGFGWTHGKKEQDYLKILYLDNLS